MHGSPFAPLQRIEMLNTPFSPWPSFTEEETDAVRRTLASNKVNYWTGQEGRAFEKEFAAWSDAAHAVAVANGTLALDLALKGIGLQAGDEVVVTPRTFIASVSCVMTAGGTPVFADVDEDSGNLTAETIARVLTPRTKAVIVVHLAGWPCDMEAILAMAKTHGLAVIEDCAQAHGARIRGRMVGSWGDVGAWSFCQDKIITTGGEGGMVTTNDRASWSRMWSYKDHGKSWDAVYERQHPPGYRWLHDSVGTNWRMLEVQSVIGRIQLTRMAEWTRRRTENALRIAAVCDRHAAVVRAPRPAPHLTHAYYRMYAYVRPEGLGAGWSRDRIMAELTSRGVPCFSGSCSEVYLERAFEGTASRPHERLPVARRLGETSLMFLVHPTLTAEEMDKTCAALDAVLLSARHPAVAA